MGEKIFEYNALLRPLKLYDRLLTVRKSKNDSRYGIVRKDNFYMDLKAMYSGQGNVTYLYTIDALPNGIDESFHSTIRSLCNDSTVVNFITDFENHKIAWESNRMVSRLRSWKILNEEKEQEVNDYNVHENISALAKNQWLKTSIRYLATADKRRGRKFLKLRIYMLVSGKRGEEFDTSIANIEYACKNTWGITINRVMYNIDEFLEVCSPFNTGFSKNITKSIGSTVVTDEVAARLSTYSKGRIGNFGYWWGNDIYTKQAVLKPTKNKSTDAEIWLITGETGSGKSNFVKALLGQVLLHPLYNATIMDIEGFEYLAWLYLIAGDEKVALLNMGEGEGKYFDPVEIVRTGSKEFDIENRMASISKSFTIAVLKILVGVSEENEWIDVSIKSALNMLYKEYNISVNDYDTWKNSEGLTLKDVFLQFKKLTPKNDIHKIALDLCTQNLGMYFEDDGASHDEFKERILLKDIIYAKLLVCSFGMAGKSEESIDKVHLNLMQLYASEISHIRSIFSKLFGMYNCKIWEEIQRWGHFPGSKKTLGVALTGGRKLGDLNILLTNKLGELVNNDELGILDAVTSFAIGGTSDNDAREKICKRFSIPELKDELDTIARENKNNTSYIDGDIKNDSPYAYAFLVGLDRCRYATTKMTIPSWLIETDLFKTGIDEKKGV